MTFTSEFRNVVTPNAPTSDIQITDVVGVGMRDDTGVFRPPLPGRELAVPPSLIANALINTRILQSIVRWMASRTPPISTMPPIPKAGIVYFPPGRYYLGRSVPPFPDSEAATDIVIPPNVSLKFALGATVVLFDYSILPLDLQGGFARLIEGRPGDTLKVGMEIQGSIDAGPWPIFDSVMEDLSTSAGWDAAPSALHTTGPVFLTRNTVPEVYPEWFGAARPPGFVEPEPTPAIVRRMTLGLQEAIEVGHARRYLPKYVPAPFTPPERGALGVSGVLLRQSGVGNNAIRSSEPGWVLFRGAMYRGSERKLPAWDPVTLLGQGFRADYDNHPPIPVVLSGEYITDRELKVGFSLEDAEHYSGNAGEDRPGPAQQPNAASFVLRGRAGLTRTGAPVATIRAHSSFAHYAPDPRVPSLARASLLGVRGPTGVWIENVAFDAAYFATRCLTFDTVTRAQMHSTGVTACAFLRALSELLHIGGEVSPVMGAPSGKPVTNTFENVHFSHGQDLLGVRVSRCIFDTGSNDNVWALSGAPTGVLYRAGQAMGAVFENCSFTGAAAPMFQAVTLRMAIVGCFFDTRAVGSGDLDGTDIGVDTPTFEGAGRFPSDPASLTIKDVVSRSPRLLASFRTRVTNVANHAAIYLIGVDHRPTLRDNQPLPPAILWAGPARSGGRLMLQGCRFDRLSRPDVAGDVLEPVAVDLAAGTSSSADIDTILGGINATARSDGHIIDLGTVVVRPGRTVRLATILPTLTELLRAARPDVAIQVRNAANATIFEKYVTTR